MFIKLDRYRSLIKKIIILIFLALYLFFVAVFFFGKIFDSYHKPFWTDEIYALQANIRPYGYIHMIVNGAVAQTSQAPLDYIFCKVLDQTKETAFHFGLTAEVYLRLFANGVTAFSALFIMFVFKREITGNKYGSYLKAAQLFLLLFLPLSYLFQPRMYYYAAEMRPYALWNSLFMIVLALSLSDGKSKKLLASFLILLAFSASAAIFQLVAFGASYFIVQIINREEYSKIFKSVIKLLAAPFLVILYYSLRVQRFNLVSSGGTWNDFIGLWGHKTIIIPVMLLILVLCLLKKENIKYALAPLAFLILFLMGPPIFFITRWRGYFYAERQFIYYELSTAVFILTLIKCIPAYVKDIRSRVLTGTILVVFFLLGSSFVFRPKLINKFNMTFDKALKVLAGDLARTEL